jgi:FeS assembly SUF system protein
VSTDGTSPSDGLTLQDFLPPGAGDTVAHAGKPLEPGTPVADRETVIEAMKTVHDPEIPVNIYDLGLIYALDIAEDGSARVLMTLTAPTCPVAGQMPIDVANAVAGVEGIGEVTVELVWEPAWTKDRMSEEARLALDMW